MKKAALIAMLALAASLSVAAEGGKRSKSKKQKAKVECCEKEKCSNPPPSCCGDKN
jgi:hypothetical protein